MKISEFKLWERQSKDSWLEQVKKDNPNIRNSEYFRIIDEDILAKSFAFPTDIKIEGHIFNNSVKEEFWKIGTRIQYEDTGTLKSALNMALENGTEYVHFILPKNLTSENFKLLIENVYLDMLITRWNFPTDEIMIECNEIIGQKFSNAKAYYTSDLTLNNLKLDIDNQTLHYTFRPYQTSTWVLALANMLQNLSSRSQKSKQIIFEVFLTNDFLLNICSIRALKLILKKIWNVFEMKIEILMEANIDNSALSQDVHSNVYKLAAMALSASLSGVDFLILPPADINTGETELQWLKSSLHAQHILKQESHLSKLIDPLAGAYFIEDLTEQVAEKVWLELQKNLRND